MGFQIVKLVDPPISLGIDLTATGAYDNATAYSVGDSVSYNGSSYVAIQATTGNLPTDTTYWQLLAEKGETGATGDTGATGPTGAAGADGADGADGVDGKTVLSGAIDPTTEGVDGDFYINTATNEIFGPKSGTWGTGVSLVGPAGADGVDGADGVMASIVAGTGIAVDSTDPANPIVSNTQTSAVWGNITGTLADQTDLATALAGAGGGNTYYDILVDAGGDGDYTTLGAAVTAATAGQTIFVRNGTYTESAITASNRVNIVGESREDTIISMGANVLALAAYYSTISNLTVTSTSGYLRVYNYCTVTNCNLISTGTNYAVWASGSYNRVTDCNISCTTTTGSYTTGIVVCGQYCIFMQNTCNVSLRISNPFYFDNECRVSGNSFAVANNASATYNICFIGSNTSFNDNVIASGTAGSGHGLSFSAGVTVTGNQISNAYYGMIAEYGASYATLSNNYILANGNSSQGIRMAYTSSDSTGVTVTGNTIVGNNYGTGIVIGRFNYSTVTGNSVDKMWTGISQVYDSSVGCTFAHNSMNLFLGAATNTNTYNKYSRVENNGGDWLGNTKKMVRMKNTSGATLPPGAPVILASAAAGNEVTSTTTASDTKIFGVTTNYIANNAFGDIVYFGNNQVKVNGTTDIAVGDYLTTYTEAGVAQKATTGNTVFAIARAAYTTDNSSGLIDCNIIPPRVL